MLLDEHTGNLKSALTRFRSDLPSEFEGLLEVVDALVGTWEEDSSQLRTLVNEHDEMQHVVDGLHYKLQVVGAERDRAASKLKQLA